METSLATGSHGHVNKVLKVVDADNKANGDAQASVVVFSSEGWDGLQLDVVGVRGDTLLRGAGREGERHTCQDKKERPRVSAADEITLSRCRKFSLE